MSRYSPRDDNASISDERQAAAPSEAPRQGRAVEPVREHPTEDRTRQEVRHGSRLYHLRTSELEAMAEIGKFRVVPEADLVRFQYRGDGGRAAQDLRSIVSQGLATRFKTDLGTTEQRLSLVALTRDAKRLLERRGPLHGQAIYSDFVKPRELSHDSAVYRMYQEAAGQIQSHQGTVTRVVLDYELKRLVFAKLGRAHELTADERNRRREAVAKENSLSIINQKIAFPDLRIEYETRDGQPKRADLELTTRHYKGRQIAAKSQAGFKLYRAGSGSQSTKTPVRDDHDLTGEVLDI